MKRMMIWFAAVMLCGAIAAARDTHALYRLERLSGSTLLNVDSAAKTELKAILDSCGSPERRYNFVLDAREMLWNIESPSHNEPLMHALLEMAVTCGGYTDDQRMRIDALLDVARVNPVGGKAANLRWLTDDGAEGQLYNISTPLTLIYFNDPDCIACHKVKERLDTCQTLRRLVEQRKLTLVAIYPYGDTDLWLQDIYPDYVLNARDHLAAIENYEAYILPSMPLFYLLDAYKTVIIKNEPSLNRVLEYINHNAIKIKQL